MIQNIATNVDRMNITFKSEKSNIKFNLSDQISASK